MDICTADLCDAFSGDIDIAEPGLNSYGGRRRFAGPLATLTAFEDNTLVREALAEPGAGRVLIVDGGASTRCALLGDRLARIAADNGWAGVVINGCIRDSVQIATMDIGVMALATSPLKSNKRGEGKRDELLRFSGVTFSPGHWIYVDEDGVIVASRNLLDDAA